jgi:hypothetical protein
MVNLNDGLGAIWHNQVLDFILKVLEVVKTTTYIVEFEEIEPCVVTHGSILTKISYIRNDREKVTLYEYKVIFLRSPSKSMGFCPIPQMGTTKCFTKGTEPEFTKFTAAVQRSVNETLNIRQKYIVGV